MKFTTTLQRSWWQQPPGKKPPASGAKMENGLFDSFASRRTRDCRQHCFAAVDFEELIFSNNCIMMPNIKKF